MLFWEKGQERVTREYEVTAALYAKGYSDAMVAAGAWKRADGKPTPGVKRDTAAGFAVSGSLADIAAAVGQRFPGSVRTN